MALLFYRFVPPFGDRHAAGRHMGRKETDGKRTDRRMGNRSVFVRRVSVRFVCEPPWNFAGFISDQTTG